MTPFLRKVGWRVRRSVLGLIYRIRIGFNPTVRIHGIIVPVDRKWSFFVIHHLLRRRYEYEEMIILEKTLESGDVVMEFGTGLGLVSAYASKKVGDNHVFTFEANVRMEQTIRKLYALNHLNPHLQFLLVCSTSEEEKILYVDQRDFWTSGTIQSGPAQSGQAIKCGNGNDLIRRFNPTYLIVDIEGGEVRLMPQLDLDGISKILLEIHPGIAGIDQTDDLVTSLLGKGFMLERDISFDEQLFFQKKQSRHQLRQKGN